MISHASRRHRPLALPWALLAAFTAGACPLAHPALGVPDATPPGVDRTSSEPPGDVPPADLVDRSKPGDGPAMELQDTAPVDAGSMDTADLRDAPEASRDADAPDAVDVPDVTVVDVPDVTVVDVPRDAPGEVAADTAERCGRTGQPCCPGQVCASPASCVAGQCRADCGRPTMACCSGRACVDGAACIDDTCRTDCGQRGQRCCDENCIAGHRCWRQSDRSVCGRCGTAGHPCCDGDSPCQAGLFCAATRTMDRGARLPFVCVNGTTQAPGTAGGFCNAFGPRCGSGLRCVDAEFVLAFAACVHCGGEGGPCCAEGTCAAGRSCATVMGSMGTPPICY